MLKIILIAAMVLLMSCAEDSPQSPMTSIEKNGLVLELSTAKSKISSGEIPDLILKMRNASDTNIVIPLFLDGSIEMERYPHTYFLINGKPQNLPQSVKENNGNLVPLSPNNFITLRQNEVYMPDMHELNCSLKEILKEKGTYNLSFVFCMESENPEDWGFDKGNEKEIELTRQLFSKVPKQTFVSNGVKIEVI